MNIGDKVIKQVRGRLNYDCSCTVREYIPGQGYKIEGLDSGGFPISWVVSATDPSVKPA